MEIIHSRTFKKQFKKLSKFADKALETKLEIFAQDEFARVLKNHKLAGEYQNCRSINITGDIRLIYEKIDKETLCFRAVGTHSELYS